MELDPCDSLDLVHALLPLEASGSYGSGAAWFRPLATQTSCLPSARPAALLAATLLACPSQPLQLVSDCPKGSACVVMSVHADSGLLRVVQAQDSTGHTTFALRVLGRIGDGSPRLHELRVTGYTDGLTCSAIGQARAAVVGNTPDGHAVVLTNRGPLALADSALAVGCRDCADVLDVATGRLVRKHRIPGGEVPTTVVLPEDVLVDSAGALFLRRSEGWLALPDSGAFRRVEVAPRPSSRLRLELHQYACT
jgi:hypothetical protein